MRDHLRQLPRPAGVRDSGTRLVPVRASNPDLPVAITCAPRTARRGLWRFPGQCLTGHRSAYTPLITHGLNDQVSVVEGPAQLIVDDTCQYWSRADRPELYSGKHKTTRLRVSRSHTISGSLAWVSDSGRAIA